MTRQIGTVAELWRYPVKSMRGGRLGSAEVVRTSGVPGDRAWAIRDQEAGTYLTIVEPGAVAVSDAVELS